MTRYWYIEKTKLIYCCFSRVCLCLGKSHMIPCFTQNYILPSSIFLITLSPDLIFFSILFSTMFQEWCQISSNQMILFFITQEVISITSSPKYQALNFITSDKNLSHTSVTNLLLRSVFANFFLRMLLRTLTSPYSLSISVYRWLQIFITPNRSSVMLSRRVRIP